MSEAFVGLDIGTTGIKALAFDADDRQLASAVVPTPTRHLDAPASGTGGPLDDGDVAGGRHAEYDADELWACAVEVLREVTGRLDESGHQAVAVATASMGESGVLIDGAGRPTGPIIAWFDSRSEPEAKWWKDHVGDERTRRITGIGSRGMFGGAKMAWTRNHRPEAWAAGRCWLNMADWMAYRLCGEVATDHSLASRTMLFDVANRCWSDELLAAAGFDRSILAPAVESGVAVGTVTAEASAATGLGEQVVVGTGGQDHVCAALGLDVTEPGMLLDSIGTAEAFFLVTDGFDPDGRLSGAKISQGAHVVPGRTYAMTGLHRGGLRIDEAPLASGLPWDEFLLTPEAEAAIEQVASEGQARIATLIELTGLDAGDTGGTGAAGGAADHDIGSADEPAGIRHLATGGGSRNTRLIERKRALGGRPIEVALEPEATALGAARLARRALAQQ